MKLTRTLRLVGPLFAGLLAAGGAVAQSTPSPGAVSAQQPDSLQIILEQQRELQADLADGGIEGLTARENRKLGEAQHEVFAVTEGKATLDALTINEKVRLENALEYINALVKNSRAGTDQQKVCWREAKTGSTIKVTRCASRAEMREAREGARSWMDRPEVCIPPGCGG